MKVKNRHFDVGIDELVVAFPVVLLILYFANGFAEMLNIPYVYKVFGLIFLIIILMRWSSNYTADFYEDMLKVNFDEKTIKRVKWLKDRKDEKGNSSSNIV